MIRRLLIRPGAIGDFIVSLPALESLGANPAANYTEVWCQSAVVPLARFAHCARSFSSVGLDRLSLMECPDLMTRLRDFDSIISWYGSANPEFRDFVAEAGLPFIFLPTLPSEGAHAVDFYNAQARNLGVNPAQFPRIAVQPGLRTFGVIHPFASGPRKCAPFALFEQAAARLGTQMPVEWLRGPEDVLPAARSFDNLYDLACFLAGARIFVGNDSGISHLAAAVGVPVVIFFRDTDPSVWAPRGPSVHIVSVT